MKRLLLVLPVLLTACDGAVTNPPDATATAVLATGAMRSASAATCEVNGKTYPRGFDQFGYNRCARNFVGTGGSWCAAMGAGWDCALYADGIPYVDDHLVMKWNAEWDRGKAEEWTKPPYDAWEDNEWNGMRSGGSGWTEHYKIKWSAGCAASGTPSSGGYCVWGDFEVVLDQGITPDRLHFWAAHVTAGGYGH